MSTARTITSTQNAFDSETISLALALRAPAFALSTEIGVEFARELASFWREWRVDGVRAACWSLAERLTEIHGAWNVYMAAKTIAARNEPPQPRLLAKLTQVSS